MKPQSATLVQTDTHFDPIIYRKRGIDLCLKGAEKTPEVLFYLLNK